MRAGLPGKQKNRARQRDVIIDTLGAASAKAQGLRQVITTAAKLRSTRHRMYILSDRGRSGAVLGFIKTGEKKLFVHDNRGKMREIEPTCVLDFYVHESCQRTGFGRQLFDHMLAHENAQPRRLAIDKPSPKCIGFLAKHYGLKDYRRQTNNYVVFRQFWEPSVARGESDRADASGDNKSGAVRVGKDSGGTSTDRTSGTGGTSRAPRADMTQRGTVQPSHTHSSAGSTRQRLQGQLESTFRDGRKDGIELPPIGAAPAQPAETPRRSHDPTPPAASLAAGAGSAAGAYPDRWGRTSGTRPSNTMDSWQQRRPYRRQAPGAGLGFAYGTPRVLAEFQQSRAYRLPPI